MTFPSVIRVFFAIDLPTPVKEKLGQFIGELKKNSKTRAVRWTKPENLHITLHFLAEVRSEDLPGLLQNVRNKAEKAVTSMLLSFGNLQLFPNPYRPRVIVLEVNPHDELCMLADLIGSGIRDSQYETDTRPFRGHLTLGRIKYTKKVNLDFLRNPNFPAFEKINASEIILFRSEPQPEGSKYSVLNKIQFAKELR